ncbi:MAG: S26 family signal peptidase [Thermoplasmatales archaeon]|nr:S26 family signal peptidase [Thermoplasmatales archaeon]
MAASRRELLEAKLNARRSSPTYWRFRDSFWFVPLIAVLVLLLVIGGLVAYTSSWPPVYVVQSRSMQHGPNDQLGLINTGDLVMSKKVSFDAITPYVVAMSSRYTTYGEYGDVVLYEPNGGTATPIIHRAIVYLQYNANGTYSAPSLAGLPCGTAANAVYRVTSSPNGCGTIGASTLVKPGWVVGVARGMIPWVGAARLLIAGNAGEVPAQSWEFLGLSVVAIVLIGFAISYAWSSFRPVDPRRAAVREREDEVRRAQEQRVETGDGGSVRRWFRRRARDENEEPEKTRSPRAVRGRPKPKVRRNGPSRPRRADAEDEDEEL